LADLNYSLLLIVLFYVDGEITILSTLLYYNNHHYIGIKEYLTHVFGSQMGGVDF